MSKKSNNNGRAYEYIMLLTLSEAIGGKGKATIRHNSSLTAAKRAWDTLTANEQELYRLSARAGAGAILDCEPLLTDGEPVELFLQTDKEGKGGDVRDLVLRREHTAWEIGLSLKHNHFAVKHSRLSHRLDFGKSWLGYPCSQDYWHQTRPVFDFLHNAKQEGRLFSEIKDKDQRIYLPLLTAFKRELLKINALYSDTAQKLAEYLLGRFDFYKVISLDKEKITSTQGFNLHDTLNQPSRKARPKVLVPPVALPTTILYLDFYNASTTTLYLSMDKGWQFTLRLHNAEKIAKPSLKFDIQLVGMPATIISIERSWY